MNRTGDDEIKEHQAEITRMLPHCVCSFSAPAYVSDKLTADLVVFDYGGMTLGNDLMQSNSRALIRWTQDHPSALVVVVSSFTYVQGVAYELRELKIISDDAPLPSSFDESIACPLSNVLVGSLCTHEKAIRRWFP